MSKISPLLWPKDVHLGSVCNLSSASHLSTIHILHGAKRMKERLKAVRGAHASIDSCRNLAIANEECDDAGRKPFIHNLGVFMNQSSNYKLWVIDCESAYPVCFLYLL